MSDPLKYPPSLNMIYELARERVAEQLEQVKALDNKANFVLGAATALVSAALILQAGLLTLQSTSSSTQNTPTSTSTSSLLVPTPTPNPQVMSVPLHSSLSAINLFHFLPLVLLIVSYFIVMISAFLAYRIRVYKQTPNPVVLFEKYLNKNENFIKAVVNRATLESYQINVKIIKRKVFWFNAALVWLAIETVMLTLFLILQTIS